MSASTPIYKLYRMGADHVSIGEIVESSNWDEFKDPMLIDCNNSVAMCFTIDGNYTKNCTRAIEMAKQMLQVNNKVIVYNYPTVQINAKVNFLSTGEEIDFGIYIEEECTKADLVLKLYKEEAVREKFVENFKKNILEIADVSEADEEVQEILGLDTDSFFSHCLREEHAGYFKVECNGEPIEGKVASCIDEDVDYPTVVVYFPRGVKKENSNVNVNMSEILRNSQSS
ncbi:hypothetical protein BX667DRAFT_535851 [Coemansia mojavensis]|nr:hypothetical protein BX667DRAFT_535851 [Coemansia mojavensis]